MKCKNCGADIPDGEVVCPVCGKTVQLVPDFDTSGLAAESAEENAAGGDDGGNPENAEEAAGTVRKRKQHPVLTVFKIIFGAALAAALFFGETQLISMGDSQSYSYQKLCAERELAAGNYDAALDAVRRASALRPGSRDARALEARVLAEKGEISSAEDILTNLISRGTYDSTVVSALADLYIESGETDRIAALIMEYGDSDLAKKYSDYVSEPPSFSLTDGNTYVYGTKLVISGTGTIYYTLDGSVPDAGSSRYNSAIILPEGTITVKAIAVNSSGIASDVSQASYTIVVNSPAS